MDKTSVAFGEVRDVVTAGAEEGDYFRAVEPLR
jgi:hypothetical protein